MIQLRTVVCYVKFGGLSRDLLQAAIRLAGSFGARVLAAAAVPIPGVQAGSYVLPDSGGVLHDVDYTQAAQELEELARSVPHQGVKLEPHMMSGDPASVLLSLLSRVHADLLMLCSRGARPLLMRLNRMEELLYRQAPCPVLSLNCAALAAGRRLATWPAGRPLRILVATAFDPPSEHAVLAGLMLARHYSAELTLLHVQPGPEGEDDSDSFNCWQLLAELSGEAQNLLSGWICPEWLNPPPKALLRYGRTDEQIIETAARLGADILVAGARRPPLGVPLWPSLASRLSAAAPCPFLVVGPSALTNLLSGLRHPAGPLHRALAG